MGGLFWCLDPTIVPGGESKLHCTLSVSLVYHRCKERRTGHLSQSELVLPPT